MSNEYVIGLDRLLRSNTSNEDILRWYEKSGRLYSNSSIKRTLKQANREDLIEYLIDEVDINLGDTVKSRMTSRVGEVVKIHTDGDTISVRWEQGGIQPLSKESVYLIDSGDITSSKDFKKVRTVGSGNDSMFNREEYSTDRKNKE